MSGYVDKSGHVRTANSIGESICKELNEYVDVAAALVGLRNLRVAPEGTTVDTDQM
jgi:hypothetical protein